MNKRQLKYKFIVSLAAVVFLSTGCFNNKKEEKKPEVKKSELKTVSPVFKEKQNKYKVDKTTEVLVDAEISKENIVRVVKHGDHWHVWTKDGVEHITYTDPAKLETGNKLSLVSVVSVERLKGMDVVKILKHGDHWHVYTSDGNEYLTYENPQSSFRNIEIGTYVGSHDDNHGYSQSRGSSSKGKIVLTNPVTKVDDKSGKDNSVYEKGSDVIRILQHEDHYHIYTRDGQEFISYVDPRSEYPNAKFGQYVGSHGDNQNINRRIKNSVENAEYVSKVLEKPSENTDKIKNPPKGKIALISVENDESNLRKLNVNKILLHENHYHIYTTDDREIISYSNKVPEIFKGIQIGEYKGSHGEVHHIDEIEWPEGIDRIVDHGDHWHLYRGNVEVNVVRQNPREKYPTAEYIVENVNKNKHIVVNESEKFKYSDVEAKLVESVLPYLDPNLQAMTDFGSLRNAEYPVYGSNNVYDDIFYWLHGNHYHAISIDQIIQNAKAGEYGTNTARDVVATLKYKVQNKGVSLEVNYDIDRTAVQKFLMKEYGIEEKLEVYNIGNNFYVYKNGKTITLHLKDFSMKDGQVVYLKDLPEIKPKENKEEKDEEIQENNTPNLFKDHEFKEPNKDEIVENQDNENELNPQIQENENQKPKEEKEENLEDEYPENFISQEERKEMEEKKEKENLEKLSKALGIDENDAFDRLYELFDELYEELGHYPAVKDIEVNDDGSIKYQGRVYTIKSKDE
ncbi:hypothetical protein ABGF48_04515 [Helcococcus bovis]|uniref:hypothetical protein n=1 Tax=Helcococcus bovis TaxID=3153252 RepID=UPI0038B99B33